MGDINFHSILSIKAVIILTGLIIIVSFVVTFIMKPSEYEKSRFRMFMSILGSIAVFLVGLSLGISAINLEEREDLDQLSITTKAIEGILDKPYGSIVKSRDARDNFLKSFFYSNVELYQVPAKDRPATTSAILEEQYIATLILQSWENFLTLRHLIITDDRLWLTLFLEWAQSPYLKKYFMMQRYIYSDLAIELGEILFEYAEKLPVPTPNPKDYFDTVSVMLEDQRMIKVLNAPAKK